MPRCGALDNVLLVNYDRVMSSVVDNLVTHPNVMNGAMLYWPEPGMQFVEGYALDEFCAGRWGRGTPYKHYIIPLALRVCKRRAIPRFVRTCAIPNG